jgi:hypothetical protein
MKKLVILLGIILMMLCVRAQELKHEIGLRLGLSSGISYEMHVDQFRAYKGLLSFREGGVQITAIIESTRPLYVNFTDRLYYYTGIGAHVGFTRFPPKNRFFGNPFNFSYNYGRFAPVLGLDGIIGLEYQLDRSPLSFCIDAKPFFELFGQNIFRLSLFDIGISMKYSF